MTIVRLGRVDLPQNIHDRLDDDCIASLHRRPAEILRLRRQARHHPASADSPLFRPMTRSESQAARIQLAKTSTIRLYRLPPGNCKALPRPIRRASEDHTGFPLPLPSPAGRRFTTSIHSRFSDLLPLPRPPAPDDNSPPISPIPLQEPSTSHTLCKCTDDLPARAGASEPKSRPGHCPSTANPRRLATRTLTLPIIYWIPLTFNKAGQRGDIYRLPENSSNSDSPDSRERRPPRELVPLIIPIT